ncbi:MAG: sigma factor-like helix-turn-helix DNA-binding protein [Eubacteriales bacterium]|nr:sigma factor-like helix-turn-helix DNA-binding protein [Eubacteriales bacterium]
MGRLDYYEKNRFEDELISRRIIRAYYGYKKKDGVKFPEYDEEAFLEILESILDKDEYKCLMLRVRDGKTFEEISRELGISANAVRDRTRYIYKVELFSKYIERLFYFSVKYAKIIKLL